MNRTIAVSLALLLITASLANASVVFTGDCYPTTPAAWNSGVDGDVGTFDYTTGSVAIDGGSSLACNEGSIGAGGTTTGTITVSGAGSIFSTAAGLNVANGSAAQGELRVEAGAVVNTGGQGRVGRVGGAVGLAVITGANSTWNIGSSCVVGWNGTGTVNVLDGASVDTGTAGFCGLGYSSGSEGTVLISGANSSWDAGTLEYRLAVKAGSTGHLTITDNATLISGKGGIGHAGSGDATVSAGGVWDCGSSQLLVGTSGSGTLTVESGGTVYGIGRIGLNSGSTGTATITGAGSAWVNSDNMVVGWSGTGSMTVTDEATVSNTDAYIAYIAGKSGSVTVSESGTWDNDGTLRVGYRGNGTMEVNTGGIVNSVDGRITDDPTATGTATVTGTGSQWNMSGYLLVGWDGGTGTLNIENGGAVTADDHVSLSQPGATGTISFNGGSLTTANLQADCANITGTGDIYAKGLVADGVDVVFDSTHGLTQDITGVGATAGVTIHLDADGSTWMGAGYEGTGSLSVSDGVVLQSTGGTLGRYAGSSATAGVSGNGSAWNMSGTLNAGYYGAATLSITDKGLVSCTGLALDNDLIDSATGAVADSFIQMKTGGMLALYVDADDDEVGDDLSASIADFLNAVAGSSDAIQWWNDVSSSWDSLTTATLGTDCTLEYLTTGDLAGYTRLTVGGGSPNIPGDANKDGKVDGSDVTILANNWQAGVTPPANATWDMGDFNGDGKVDGSDVTILANNWQYGVTTAASAVPEPGALVILLGGIASLLVIRRRK